MDKLVIGWVLVILGLAIGNAQITWEEHNGLVVMEIESVPAASGWIKQTAVDGYTGSGYYTWNVGTSSSITSAGQGVLTYRVKINNAGTYNLRLHNYHNYPADQTLENDCWLKVDSGNWIKCFQNGGNAGYWNFICKLEPSHGVFENAVYELSAGYHTIQISGRSYNYSIDRIHLYRMDMVMRSLSTGHPESPREGEAVPAAHTPQIIAPAAGTVLRQGEQVTLIGSGPMLFWRYDQDADGEGITSLSIQDTASYTIPERTGLEKISFVLYSSFMTVSRTYDVLPPAAVHDDFRVSDHREQVRVSGGTVRLAPGSGAETMYVYAPDGRRIASLRTGTGTTVWSGKDRPAGVYLVGLAAAGTEEIIPVVLTR